HTDGRSLGYDRLVKKCWLLLLLSLNVWAHMMSMSSGDVTLAGNRAKYQLRMPMYEVAHIKDPQRSIFEHIHFRSGGEEARLLFGSCKEVPVEGAYLCAADYQFTAPVDRLEVECTFHSITVPNHVHLLRAEKEGKRDQALFDFSFSKANLRF